MPTLIQVGTYHCLLDTATFTKQECEETIADQALIRGWGLQLVHAAAGLDQRSRLTTQRFCIQFIYKLQITRVNKLIALDTVPLGLLMNNLDHFSSRGVKPQVYRVNKEDRA